MRLLVIFIFIALSSSLSAPPFPSSSMTISYVQKKHLIRILEQLQPHVRTDLALPSRIRNLLSAPGFGSRDRRLYRELIYTSLRFLPWIEPCLTVGDADEAVRRLAWLASDSMDTSAFCSAFATGEEFGGSDMSNADRDTLLPEWFRYHCSAAFEPVQRDSLLKRAPLWLRRQNVAADAVLLSDGLHGVASPALSSALRLPEGSKIEQCTAYTQGLVEIQDLGSQFLLETLGLENSGGHWLDACAGAGGKTLQLAQLLGSSGRITATDIRSSALQELEKRAVRAGLNRRINTIPTTVAGLPQGAAADKSRARSGGGRATSGSSGLFDGVLVDAPCSGSGTWRRQPHLKWTTSPATVQAAARVQLALLEAKSKLVKPGGWLVYATCSLSAVENGGVAAEFQARAPSFEPAPMARDFGFRRDEASNGAGLTILPAAHDTDGFFIAAWKRRR